MNRLATALVISWAVSHAAFAAPPAGFENRVEQLRYTIGVPGLSIAIVEDHQVTLAQGFGVRALGSAQAVDADTIFPTGSTGKAFTVAALGVLVDAGKIKWDDKVIDHLPGFQMYDPWVTREMTIRDLLVHRSGLGLGAGDLLFVPRTNLSRAESVRRLRYIKPATSFRSGFAYDNVVHGRGATHRGRQRPNLGRVHRRACIEAGRHDPFHDRRCPSLRHRGPRAAARAHGRRSAGIGNQSRLDERDDLGANAAPAGGLAISANDMARWLMIQLDAGKLPGQDGRLFSEAAHEQMWRPMTLQPVAPRPDALKLTQPMFNTYALGWDVRDYRGAKIVWHGGAVFGFLAAVVLIPEKQVGFSILINSEDGELINGLMYELLDHYLGQPNADWPAKFQAYKQQRAQDALKAYKSAASKPAKAGPSLPLANYVGTYQDAWYGNIEIAQTKTGLHIDFKSTPRMGGVLEHYQYDSFVTRFDDKTIEPAYVTFGLNADGHVERITLKPVSPIADFSYDYQDLLFTPLQATP